MEETSSESKSIYSDSEYREALKRLGYSFEDDATAEEIRSHCEWYRTDESAWMAMDDVLSRKFESTELIRAFGGGWNYSIPHKEDHFSYFVSSGDTRQAAVYDVYMQFIREELKSK